MKTTKTPDPHSVSFAEKLKKHYSEEEIASFILTLLGMSDIAHRFLWEKVKDFMELPVGIKYSTLQHASFYRALSAVARGDCDTEDTEVQFMPIDEKSWQSEEDFEKRFIFLVKSFYDALKKEGKV